MVGRLLRVAWRTVGRILTRAVEAANASVDLLASVRRIGISGTSQGRPWSALVHDHLVSYLDVTRHVERDPSPARPIDLG